MAVANEKLEIYDNVISNKYISDIYIYIYIYTLKCRR